MREWHTDDAYDADENRDQIRRNRSKVVLIPYI